MTCPRCAHEVAEGANLCENCGEDLRGAARPRARTTSFPSLAGGAYAPGHVVLARYQIKEVIARGRLGAVYKAHDRMLRVDVALKVFQPALFPDPEARRVFVQQVGRLRGLQHRNVVRLFDVHDDGERCLLNVQLVEGLSLRKVVQMRAGKGQRFEPGEVRPLILQVAAALSGAHTAGALHGAVKPEDLLLLPDHLKLTGIGVLPSLARNPVMLAYDALPPGALAPEIPAGEPVTACTDVYGLGAVLYELIVGEPPGDVLCSVRAVDAAWPPATDSLLARALDPDPERRYSRVADFATDLQSALGGGRATATVPPTPPPPPITALPPSAKKTLFMAGGAPPPVPPPPTVRAGPPPAPSPTPPPTPPPARSRSPSPTPPRLPTAEIPLETTNVLSESDLGGDAVPVDEVEENTAVTGRRAAVSPELEEESDNGADDLDAFKSPSVLRATLQMPIVRDATSPVRPPTPRPSPRAPTPLPPPRAVTPPTPLPPPRAVTPPTPLPPP
ncbi:MAG: serine/threonine-protein kinase, partial [Myxococcota bacterium]